MECGKGEQYRKERQRNLQRCSSALPESARQMALEGQRGPKLGQVRQGLGEEHRETTRGEERKQSMRKEKRCLKEAGDAGSTVW